jgi:hypothetical protein
MGSQAENVYQLHEGKNSMPSNNGYVNLWRDINKQSWASDELVYGVFVKLLSTVQHKPRSVVYKGVSVNLAAGEWAIDYPQIVEMFKGIKDKDHARRIIKKFKNLSQVYTKTLKDKGVHIGFIIGFNGWEKWQNCTTPKTTPKTTPEATNIKAFKGSETTPQTTPQTTHINNNDLNNKKEYADPEALRVEKINEVRVKGFEHFWKSWREGKKAIGVNQRPPKNDTYRKNFLKAFPDSYMKKIGHKGFVKEINDMLDLMNEAFSDIESCQAHGKRSDFENYVSMFPALFLTRKQWREEA